MTCTSLFKNGNNWTKLCNILGQKQFRTKYELWRPNAMNQIFPNSAKFGQSEFKSKFWHTPTYHTAYFTSNRCHFVWFYKTINHFPEVYKVNTLMQHTQINNLIFAQSKTKKSEIRPMQCHILYCKNPHTNSNVYNKNCMLQLMSNHWWTSASQTLQVVLAHSQQVASNVSTWTMQANCLRHCWFSFIYNWLLIACDGMANAALFILLSWKSWNWLKYQYQAY
jgi:hypothetical protein